MKNNLIAITTVLLGSVLFVFVGDSSRALGYCQVFCGIYDGEARIEFLLEDAITNKKCMTQINELRGNLISRDTAARPRGMKDLRKMKIRLVAGIHYIPFWKKFNNRDVENIIIKYLNAGANSIRVFLYQDGRDSLMNYYEKKGEKYDLDTFSKEYFDRIELLGKLAKKYNFILKIDVLDNCSFFKDNFKKHSFNNNIQGLKVSKNDIYGLNPNIKKYIFNLYKKHWEIGE